MAVRPQVFYLEESLAIRMFKPMKPNRVDDRFAALKSFMTKIPGVRPAIASGEEENGTWWLKFQIDLNHPLAWNIVQELGHILNYLSIDERLPTTFYPVSPPPYMNGGPKDFLSWVVETTINDFEPELLLKWLEGRLPRPVDDLVQWQEE